MARRSLQELIGSRTFEQSMRAGWRSICELAWTQRTERHVLSAIGHDDNNKGRARSDLRS